MNELEIAKIFAVEGSIDRPVSELKSGASAEVAVQFNPSSLRVAMSNSLKENERSGNSRSAQFVDKSSSSLTVELIFDTTDQFIMEEGGGGDGQQTDKRKDVRNLTKAIADTFMASNARSENESSPEDQAPHRCMFAWGSFAFVGIMESFDETLNFFSSEGTPLRATVSIKISESRYEFRSDEEKEAARNTPVQSPAADSMNDASWRNNALFNGVESPRAPTSDSLSNPGLSAGASLGLSAGIGGGISGGVSAGIGGSIGGGFSAGSSVGVGAGISASSSFSASAGIGGLSAVASITPPSFKFGSSSSIGTSIPGAFSLDFKNTGGFTAGGIIATKKSQAASAAFSSSAGASASSGFAASASAGGKAKTSIGFD